MRNRFFSILLLCATFSVGVVCAAGNMELVLPDLSAEEMTSLRAGEMLDSSTLGGQIHPYIPLETEAYKRATQAEDASNSFTINTLSFIPYPEHMKDKSLAERQLILFNTMRRLSTQAGITYISHRAGNKPKVLFEDSSYLADPKKRSSRIDDPVVTEFPLSHTDYAYQKDSSFGGNVYRHTYTNSDREIFLEVQNLSSMKVLGIFTAVPVEQLTMVIGTYQLDDGLLVMSLATVEDKPPKVSVLGYTVDLPSSFLKRITSLQDWFVAQLQN